MYTWVCYVSIHKISTTTADGIYGEVCIEDIIMYSLHELIQSDSAIRFSVQHNSQTNGITIIIVHIHVL